MVQCDTKSTRCDSFAYVFLVDFVLKDPREQDDEKKEETPDYKLE